LFILKKQHTFVLYFDKKQKSMKFFLIIFFVAIRSVACGNQKIVIVSDEAQKKIDILYDGKLFTSYIYPSDLEKPVLYPIYTATGTVITRGFPRVPRPFERFDHLHQIGSWFNFGDVNGIDFWNNNAERKNKEDYGSIRFKNIVKIEGAKLIVESEWVDFFETALLKEETTFNFSGSGDWRIVERISKLTALLDTITFTDNKEGLIAIRMAREFEEPDNRPAAYLDANLNRNTKRVVNDEGKTGVFRNSEGLEKGDVWGKPTNWVTLSGEKDGEKISVAIVDHKNNHGFPANSHARGYGLFATNNMGNQAFDKSNNKFVLQLKSGESTTFKHLIVVKTNGFVTDHEMNKIFIDFNE